jgi:hypothetical protein
VPDDLVEIDEDEHGSQATVAGKIESIDGAVLTVQTQAGSQQVRLAERARVDGDALGSSADLKPGQFVGIAHAPGGPADVVRLYTTGPSMPSPGVVPVVGSRVGQMTTFGSIVKLEFGGVLLNTGSQTTAVTLPNGVEILRPVQQARSDLAVGTQVLATGSLDDDGALVATALRVTGDARPRR